MRLLPLLSLGQACFTPQNYILIDSRFRGENGMCLFIIYYLKQKALQQNAKGLR